MSGNLDDFERQLTGDLQHLAERAPPGPGATAIMQALRRRTARRTGAAVGGLACLFVGLMLLWPGAESPVTRPDGQFASVDPWAGDKLKPQVVEKVTPLPISVTSAQLETLLKEYVDASHADRLIVRKSPG